MIFSKNVMIYLGGAALIFAVGFLTAKNLSPTIKMETVEKVVEKEVVRKDVQVVVKTYDKDGKVVSETVTNDKSQISTDKKSDKKETMQAVLPSPKPDWHISASADSLSGDLKANYGLQVERRILGPVFIGGRVDTKNNYSVTVGVEF